MKITIIAAAIAFSAEVSGAQVVGRVLSATPESINVEVSGTSKRYPLAGVGEIAPIADAWRVRIAARLSKELVGKFVMLESDGDAFLAFRSPDALPINEWLVGEGLAIPVGDCGSCAQLRRLHLRARTTGQGWWSTGNTISAVVLTEYEYLGQANPAGKSTQRQDKKSEKPEAAKTRKRGGRSKKK